MTSLGAAYSSFFVVACLLFTIPSPDCIKEVLQNEEGNGGERRQEKHLQHCQHTDAFEEKKNESTRQKLGAREEKEENNDAGKRNEMAAPRRAARGFLGGTRRGFPVTSHMSYADGFKSGSLTHFAASVLWPPYYDVRLLRFNDA